MLILVSSPDAVAPRGIPNPDLIEIDINSDPFSPVTEDDYNVRLQEGI